MTTAAEMSTSLASTELGSLRSRAISAIRTRIQDGELPAGHTFSEVTMTSELGMSRAPVREALIVLSTSGWVDALPRAGYRVRSMTLNEARDLFALRLALEPRAAAAAAVRAPHDAGAVAHLEEFCALEEDAETPLAELVNGMYRCHRRIARLSANLEYDRCLEDVLARSVRYYRLEPVAVALREPLGHRPVVEAVLAGDAATAEAAMSDLLTRDQQRVVDAIIDSDLIRAVELSRREGS